MAEGDGTGARCVSRNEVFSVGREIRIVGSDAAMRGFSAFEHCRGPRAGTPGDFVRFLRIANGSRQELETQAVLAESLGFFAAEQSKGLLDLAEEVGRLLGGLIRSLE